MATIGLVHKLYGTLTAVPHLSTSTEHLEDITWPSLAIVVPAYNEAANVVDCLSHILDSTERPFQLFLADDSSEDNTLDLARSLAAGRDDPRLQILAVPPRPTATRWVGKSWACDWACRQIEADYLLFVDCDVRLQPGAIEAAVYRSAERDAGLLSVGPELVCQSWAEWLVQPVMAAILGAGFDCTAVNDPTAETAFAAGPFMLFRQSTYRAIGGHAAVRDCVVEDVAFAKRVKSQGLGLHYCFSGGLVRSRMYRDLASLWEGWSKNLFEGLDRRWELWSLLVIALATIYILPWGAIVAGACSHHPVWLVWGGLGLLGQLALRWLLARWGGLPARGWWLAGLGGGMAIALLVSSAYRTTTGRGWTWRGRSL